LSKRELADVARVVRELASPDVRIYSDEIYEHCLFDGEKHHSIATEPGMEERTIIASGHSKGFAMTGWRLGWVVMPTAEEAAVFKQLTINVMSCVPPFIQEAGRVALESPESAPHTQTMVSAFQQRRDWIVPALNAIPGVRCQNPKGAFYVFPNISRLCEQLGVVAAHAALPEKWRKRTSPSAMFQMFLLYSYGVATMDRNSFGKVGAEGQHFLRLSIATSMARLQEGVERMQRAATDEAGFRLFLDEEGLYSDAPLAR
jgi:aspartate/methionine/tyrosine aminotransferase